jgi:hypothetical protein
MPTEISIDNIEDSLKDRLDTKLAAEIAAGDIEVEVLPDTPGAFKRAVAKKRRVSVCYLDTDFDKTMAPDVVAQNAFNKFGLFVAAKARRGPNGINDLIRLCVKYLVGFRPLGHEKITAVKIELYQRDTTDNMWMAKVELRAQYMLVEFNDDPPEYGTGTIQEITFNPPAYGGETVVVNSDTEISQQPPANNP